MSAILLSFDVEEFDLPLEYKYYINPNEQMKIGYEGLEAITDILENVCCTLFTTANFAQHFPTKIYQLAQQHEIASHSLYHSSFETKHLKESKEILEAISKQRIVGLRMPRMRQVDMDDVKAAGYIYDSSVNPTWIPGRYNYRHLPRTVYTDNSVLRIPASVTPRVRIPLFWLAFKNLPYHIFRKFALQTLQKDGYLNLYFHPWEFTDICNYSLPGYVKKDCGSVLIKKLKRLVSDLRQEGKFISIKEYLKVDCTMP